MPNTVDIEQFHGRSAEMCRERWIDMQETELSAGIYDAIW